jgi:hypothetical protein
MTFAGGKSDSQSYRREIAVRARFRVLREPS